MATILRLASRNWWVQVRRKGRYISETFRRHKDAEEWALDIERRIDLGESPRTASFSDPTTFGHLIDLHFADMKEVGKPPQRSTAFSLDALQKRLGKVRIADITRERLVTFGRDRTRATDKMLARQATPFASAPMATSAYFSQIRASTWRERKN